MQSAVHSSPSSSNHSCVCQRLSHTHRPLRSCLQDRINTLTPLSIFQVLTASPAGDDGFLVDDHPLGQVCLVLTVRIVCVCVCVCVWSAWLVVLSQNHQPCVWTSHQNPHTDSDAQVMVVGVIRDVEMKATKISMTIEDHTGEYVFVSMNE